LDPQVGFRISNVGIAFRQGPGATRPVPVLPIPDIRPFPMQYWLFKSEPSTFSIDDLNASPGRRTPWDGVRNYQARNMIRDSMHKGDLAFFHHSSCDQPGIAGIVEIAGPARPDPTAFDPAHHHFDPGSSPDAPRWYLVDVRLKRRFRRVITLEDLRQHRPLAGMQLLKRGNRLSVMPVTKKEWDYVLGLER
jgi:predicted RNA-binding protein with PUA-like domain